jgi:hypothetical protein
MSKTKAVTAETPGTVVRIANRRERSGSVWIGPRIADLAFDLFEALGVLALQQRRGQSISAVLGGGAVFHQGLAGEMKRFELEQGFATRGAGSATPTALPCAPALPRPDGLRQRADRLCEAARLTEIDLGVRNACHAQRAFESAVIGPGRLEDDPIHRGLGQPFDLWPLLSLTKRRLPPSVRRWASKWSFEISTPMVSFFIFSAPLLVIRGVSPSIRAGRRKRRGRSNSKSTRQTVSVAPIRPSPLSRGPLPSPAASFMPLQREKP